MGRHKKSVNRPIVPDAKYNSAVVTKFITRMMLDGKKETCTKIIYEAMDKLKAKTNQDPLEVFNKALDNGKPLV
ncbi:MAG: 30S ribosomal protein S7, partial [Treponemataceae bacterium]|nr:30S ribosomal protein S7 [Treponemataceae bacterium]